MGENTITNTGAVDLQMRVSAAYHPAQSDTTALAGAAAHAAPMGGKPGAREATAQPAPRENSERAEARTPLLPLTNNDIALKFRIDEKTRDVTVFVVDRASDRVLRTIPADELQKMSAGDLIKMAA